MKSLAKNSLFNIFKSGMNLLFPLITFTYASRIFLSAGMGQIEFSKSFVTYFNLLAMLGITNYGTREGAKVRDDKQKLSILSVELLILNSISFVIAYAIFIVVINVVPVLAIYRLPLLIYSSTILLNVIGIEWLYNAVEDYQYIAIRSFVIQILSLLLMFIFVHKASDLWKYVLIQALATSGNCILNFINSRKYISFKLVTSLNVKKHIKPVLVLFCMTVFIQIFTHMDSTMLGLMTSDEYVGLYSASNKMTAMVAALVTAISMVAMPRIAYYVDHNDWDRIRALISDIIGILLMIGIPATMGMIILSKEIINIFCGSAFDGANLASKIMSLRIILVPMNSFIVLHLFIPLGKERQNLVSTGLAAVTNLIINYIFIPKYFHLGAACATVMAESIELVINIVFLSQIVRLGPVFKDVWKYVIASVSIIPIYWVINYFIKNSLLMVVLCSVFSLIAYISLLLIMKVSMAKKLFNKIKKVC
jgi:O-antigen/teichoic acid export membrane protein